MYVQNLRDVLMWAYVYAVRDHLIVKYASHMTYSLWTYPLGGMVGFSLNQACLSRPTHSRRRDHDCTQEHAS